jgi:predicted deacetylase
MKRSDANTIQISYDEFADLLETAVNAGFKVSIDGFNEDIEETLKDEVFKIMLDKRLLK